MLLMLIMLIITSIDKIFLLLVLRKLFDFFLLLFFCFYERHSVYLITAKLVLEKQSFSFFKLVFKGNDSFQNKMWLKWSQWVDVSS